ncbi:MAG: DinB family protein [Bacteroidetes bacterium]|nr:DinB family protein [Bacteroidota bacterium]
MKKYFLKLFQYNAWANRQVLFALNKQNVVNKKIFSLMGHVAAAEMLWLHRVKSLPKPDVKLWSTYTLSELEEMFNNIDRQWLEFIEATEVFDRELNYTNYAGDPFTNNMESIIIHTANHASYHRAQVALLLRQNGFEPVNTDFITYDRIMRGQLQN